MPRKRLLPAGLRVRVRVPATTANLGPGFDALGLALSLHDRIELEVIPSGVEVELSGPWARGLGAGGEGATPGGGAVGGGAAGGGAAGGGAAAREDLTLRAARTLLHAVGVAAPGLRLRVDKQVPWGRGLGSSAAAIVGGLVAANELAIAGYQARPYPRRLTVFRAADSRFDSPEAVASGLGWDPVAGAGLDLIEIPGEHLSMLEPPHVQCLAACLRRILDG